MPPVTCCSVNEGCKPSPEARYAQVVHYNIKLKIFALFRIAYVFVLDLIYHKEFHDFFFKYLQYDGYG